MGETTIDCGGVAFGLLPKEKQKELRSAAKKKQCVVFKYIGGDLWVSTDKPVSFCQCNVYKAEVAKETKVLNARGVVFGLLSTRMRIKMRTIAERPESEAYICNHQGRWKRTHEPCWLSHRTYKVIYEVQ